MRNSRIIIMMDGITQGGATDAIGNNVDVSDFKNVVISLVFGEGTMKVKIQGSIEQDAPTFSSAQSGTNIWDYVDCLDIEDGSSIDGDDGLNVQNTADYRLLKVNTDGLKWLNIRLVEWWGGTLYVKVRLTDNR